MLTPYLQNAAGREATLLPFSRLSDVGRLHFGSLLRNFPYRTRAGSALNSLST